MPDFPLMMPPSTLSTVAFVCVVALVAALIVAGTYVAGRRLSEPLATTRLWAFGTLVALILLLAVTAVVAASGILEVMTPPPRGVFFLAACNLLGLGWALLRPGARLVAGLPIAALVGFQAFRLPLELVLHRFYVEGVLPVQMTYAGRNFDIVTGSLALFASLWLWRRGTSRPLIWAFNLIGLGLLINVGTIAMLSMPTPFRVFLNDPPVLLPFYVPTVWIVPLCVVPALAGHVLVFRWLLRNR